MMVENPAPSRRELGKDAPSRRELGKDARRSRIVRAAAGLLREVTINEMSVKMIADRAELSPATVYNLFGTKAAVLLKVYEHELLAFERSVSATKTTDALDAIFGAVTLLADFYRSDPRFYRAAMASPNAGLDPDMVVSAYRPRVAFWSKLVERAVADGLLVPDASAERLGVLLIQISGGVLGHWGADIISIDGLELETSYGFACALLPFATETARPGLRARLRCVEAALEASTRLAVAAPMGATG